MTWESRFGLRIGEFDGFFIEEWGVCELGFVCIDAMLITKKEPYAGSDNKWQPKKARCF